MLAPDKFTSSVRGQVALQYAIERGWAVLPLWWVTPDGRCACGKSGKNHKAGKHPIGRLVPHGVKDATNDPNRIREWWNQCPEANIGAAMGEKSEAFAIDLDGAKAHRLFADVQKSNNAAPIKTLVSETGRGSDGHHVVIKLPDGARVGTVNRKDIGIDIIGTGSYIVVPPSNHISGGTYKWIRDFPLANPEPWLMNWVFSLFDRGLQKGHQSPVSLDLPGAPPPGFKSCERLADGLSEGLSAPSPAPPWSEYEDAKLRSALDYVDSNGRRIWDPNASYEIWGKTVAPAIASLAWGSQGEDIFVYWSAQTTVDGLFPGEEACREQVRFFKKGRTSGCITEATIFRAAIDAGWKEPAPQLRANNVNQDLGSKGQTASTDDAGATAKAHGSQPLPIINVIGGGLSDEATAGEGAIIKAGHPVYHRGTTLVRPIIAEVDATHGRRTKVAQLVVIRQPYMIDLLCKSAEWTRYDRRQKKWVRINPPDDIARIILDRCGEWKFDPVIGVITTPTLRPDGSLLAQPGYDPTTWMVLMEPPLMPAISAQPSRDEAIAALNLLDGLLEEFPFVDEASRSVAVSSLITPVVRGAMTVVPMHAVSAPAPGTGKSFLFDISAAIATGQPCPVMAAGRTEEETEKRLGAALIAGQPIINIDNVNGDLGGDALCQSIERPVVEIRVLGKSERVRIEARSTVFATGNNLRLLGDMTRRVVLGTLDANRERPELRQFKRDPVAEVLTDRGRYIAAALTVVLAYLAAGRPNPAPRLASFQGWSDTVRSALIWLGRPDPVETMEIARRDDPNLQAMQAVFAALKDAIGVGEDRAISAAEIAQRSFEPAIGPNVIGQLRYPGLKEVLLTVAEKHGAIDARELGKWLGRHKGRIAKGIRLEGRGDEHGHATRWWLSKCG